MPREELDFEKILRVLVKHKVDFILVGGLCAVLHGAPIQTFDLDMVPSREPENLTRLQSSLRELGAYYREHPPGPHERLRRRPLLRMRPAHLGAQRRLLQVRHLRSDERVQLTRFFRGL